MAESVAPSRAGTKSALLRAHLLGLIEGGLKPHDKMPTERELAETFGVTRLTVRRALDQLGYEGRVYRTQGAGTFVSEPRIAKSVELTSFSDDMRARGLAPGSQLAEIAEVPAGAEIGARLGISPRDAVTHIYRVRTADGEPMALERTHLPAQRLPGLESADLTDASLYELLERTWDVRVADADQWASVVRLTTDEAAILQVDADQPALLFQRLTRDPVGAPIEYVRSLYRGDRYEVHTRLERRDG